MSSVWVILIDVSGSMGQGFSGKIAKPDILAETGGWKTKLEAAKEILVRVVHETGRRDQDIAVIAFSSHARRIFFGSAIDFKTWESEIDKLRPEDRTNLAEGLQLATSTSDYEPYAAISVLVISDGLSNVGNPKHAAQEFIQKYPHGRIDTILIDDTGEEGRSIAETISIHGWVRPAYSFKQLEQEVVTGRVVSQRQALDALTYQRYSLAFDLSQATNQRAPALLTLTSPEVFDLTPQTLSNEIAPFFVAMENLERTACDLNETPYTGNISSISKSSPVSVTISGLEKALDSLSLIFPWRREHARQMARLKEERLKAENQKIRSEAEEGFARARKVGAEADELEHAARLKREEAEVAELLRRKEDLYLLQQKLSLAEKLLFLVGGEEYIAKLRRQEIRREVYLERMLEAIEQLLDSRLEFDIRREPSKNIH